MFDFFKTKTPKQSFSEILKKHLDNAKNKCEQYGYEEGAKECDERNEEYHTDKTYTSNHLRQIIPIVSRAESNMHDRVTAMLCIQTMCKELNQVRDNKDKYVNIIDSIGRGKFNDYLVVRNNETNDIILFSNDCNNFNLKNPSLVNECAVVTFDMYNNTVKCYTTTQQLIDENIKYQAVRPNGTVFTADSVRESIIDGSEWQTRIGSDTEAVFNSFKECVNSAFDTVAVDIYNQLADAKETLINLNIKARIKEIANNYAESKMNYFEEQSTAIITHNYEKAYFRLEFTEDTLIDVYYQKKNEPPFKIYDIKDSSNGFLALNNETYNSLLNDKCFLDVMSICGIEMEKEAVSYEYGKNETSLLGKCRYYDAQIDNTELANRNYTFDTSNVDLLAKMSNIEDMYKATSPQGTRAFYNKYNNSINVYSGVSQLCLLHNEKGVLTDMAVKNIDEPVKDAVYIMRNNRKTLACDNALDRLDNNLKDYAVELHKENVVRTLRTQQRY